MRRLAAAAIAVLLLVGCETRNGEDDDGWCAGNTFNTARATMCVAQRLDEQGQLIGEQNQLLAELIDVLEEQP